MLSQQSPWRATSIFMLALMMVVMSPSTWAQTTVAAGSISGTVTDATGAVVAGAKVTITGPTGQIAIATTNAHGGYSTGSLIPGAYKVRIEAKGFKTAQLPEDVKVDTTAMGSVNLEPGAESTVVDVQATDDANLDNLQDAILAVLRVRHRIQRGDGLLVG